MDFAYLQCSLSVRIIKLMLSFLFFHSHCIAKSFPSIESSTSHLFLLKACKTVFFFFISKYFVVSKIIITICGQSKQTQKEWIQKHGKIKHTFLKKKKRKCSSCKRRMQRMVMAESKHFKLIQSKKFYVFFASFVFNCFLFPSTFHLSPNWRKHNMK